MILAPFLLATTFFQQPQRMSSLTGNIERIDRFESKILGNSRNLIVYLPPNYKQDTKTRYPVVYMHDGQNIFDGATSYIPNQEWRADEAAEALIEAGLIEPLIIVGIDNAGMERANEYLPTKFKWNNSEIGGKADLYGRMITDEIMPIINERYRTKTGPDNTGLIGSSFGGVATCYLGATHPEIFGRLGVVSPSVWVDDRILLKLIKPTERRVRRPRVWIDIGGKEGADAVRDTRDLYDVYVQNGWKPRTDVVLYIEQNAEHNELAWSRRIPSILTYLFPKK
ncbi:MAG: alpha/beta hydrolase [Armatimonadetes bacterium]|nr:alpha/beta hydrolase [Armatimonadota bacterium]